MTILTEAQKVTIQEIQTKSLERFCAKFGINENSFKRMEVAIEEEQRSLVRKRILAENPKFLARYDMLLGTPPKDFWDYYAHHANLCRNIDNNFLFQASGIPANEPYLIDLTNKLGWGFDNLAQTIKGLVDNIPNPILFDLEFTGYVSHIHKLGEVPVLYVYPHLLECLNDFIDIMLECLTVPRTDGTGFKWRPQQSFDQLLDSPPALANLTTVIHRIRGKTPLSIILPAASFSNSSHGQDLMSVVVLNEVRNGAKRFVKFHEYGHLLFGHLERENSADLEHEADFFAASVIFQAEETHGELHWWGISILFSIFAFLENFDVTNENDLPKANERLKQIIHQFGNSFDNEVYQRSVFLLNLIKPIYLRLEETKDIYSLLPDIDSFYN